MPLLTYPSRLAECKICSSMVSVERLHEHLLADARMLRVIKTSRPEWGRQECEEYLRTLCSPTKRPKSSESYPPRPTT